MSFSLFEGNKILEFFLNYCRYLNLGIKSLHMTYSILRYFFTQILGKKLIWQIKKLRKCFFFNHRLHWPLGRIKNKRTNLTNSNELLKKSKTTRISRWHMRCTLVRYITAGKLILTKLLPSADPLIITIFSTGSPPITNISLLRLISFWSRLQTSSIQRKPKGVFCEIILFMNF